MSATRGRKALIAEPGKRVSLGLKVTSETKNKLDAAARANGRTQSQEAEYRLQKSFDRNEVLAAIEGVREEIRRGARGPNKGAFKL